MEDDLKFVEDFQTKLAAFLSVVPDDWDALYLGGQYMTPPTEVVPGVLKAGGLDGIHRTHAYTLRGNYLKKVYRLYSSSMGHCDHVVGRSHANHRVYGADPWLALQSADAGASDINGKTPDKDRDWAPKQKRIVKTGVPARTATVRGQTVRPCCGEKPASVRRQASR